MIEHEHISNWMRQVNAINISLVRVNFLYSYEG